MLKNIKKLSNKTLIYPIVAFFGIVYLLRMFLNHPWYDELYTYYSFISKGPIYAAIHWPLPNNHMGYSALAACFGIFGQATIALRGVSFIAATLNIYLIYKLSEKLVEKYSLIPPVLYGTMFLVHNISVQGRGYTLATTCYLVALLSMYMICSEEKAKRRYYILFAGALSFSAYILASSAFFIVPVCLTGGLYLLINKKYKTLLRLVMAGVVAGLIAMFLYSVVWLAIGSNLLSKTDGSGFTGVYQISIIKEAPIKALSTGIDYMLATPYIQSIERSEVISGMFGYLSTLFGQYYSGLGEAIVIFLLVVLVLSIVCVIKKKESFLEMFLLVSIVMLPVMLIIQSQQPYYRVFSYFGVVVALSFSKMLNQLKIPKSIACIIALLSVALLFTPDYMAPMASRENDIYEASELLAANKGPLGVGDTILYADDYQKYVFKFYYDLDMEEKPMGEAKYIFLPKDLNGVWPMLFDENNFDFDSLNNCYEEVAATDQYTVYSLK